MASNFAQYTNGVVMPTGISEAGANIGQFAAKGLSSFGQSLGEGLQAYNENVAKDQVLQEEAKQLGNQIQQFASQFGDSPEHAPFAESLKPYIEQLAKVPSMSLTQKMGAVTGVKAAFANIGQNLQVFEMMRKERLQRTMAEADAFAPKEGIIYNPSAIKEGTVAFDPNKSVTQNIADFDNIIKGAQAKGHDINADEARQKFIANMRQSIQSNNKIDPQLKATMTDQLDAYNPYQENAMTDENGVTDYSKEADLYGKVSTSALDAMAQKNAPETGAVPAEALKKYTEYQATLEKDIADILKEQKKLEEEKTTKDLLKPFEAPMSPTERLGSGILDLLDKQALHNAKKYVSKDPETGEPIIDRNKVVKDFAETWFTAGGMLAPFGQSAKVAKSLTEAGLSPVQQLEQDKLAAKALGASLPLEQRVLDNQIRLQQTKDMLSKVSEVTGKLSPALGEQAKPEQPTVAPITNTQDFQVGQKADVMPVSFEEKKQAIQNYFMSKYKDASGKSYLPAGFDEAFRANNPEASFKTMETPYGAFAWNGKEWNQIKTAQPKTVQQQREEMKGVFGTMTDKGLAPMQIGEGTGVRVQGLFTGTDGELGKYKDNISAMASARSAIAELRTIVSQFGHSVSPTLIGRAKIAMATLRAATRIEVIGVGTVSEMEQKMLNDANPDTTTIFRLDAVDIAKLDSLSRKIDNKIKMESSMNGISVSLAPPVFGREGREAIEAGLRERNPQLYRR